MSPPRVSSLLSPGPYELELGRLRAKAQSRGRGGKLETAGVSLSALGTETDGLCRAIAQAVASNEFRFRPLRKTRAVLEGKARTLYRAELVDAIVLGALAQRLTGLAEARLSDDVFSFRPGRSTWQAIRRVQEYLDAHRQARPDVRQRGIWVLQRDIEAFGDSIPTTPDSPLWSLIDTLLGSLECRAEAKIIRALLREACRPEFITQEDERLQLECGLPTGSPIQQPLQNLYLSTLDHELATYSGSLYTRFGDDLLFMTERREIAIAASADMRRITAGLGLSLKAHKLRDLFFTKPGRPPAAGADGWHPRPASHIEYLGARIDFQGRLGLKKQRSRELQGRWRRRIRNLVSLADESPSERLETLARGLAQSLDPHRIVSDRATAAFSQWVDSREQLKQFDYLLALECAQALSGARGVRAFRRISPRALREAGLPSLAHQRRRGGSSR